MGAFLSLSVVGLSCDAGPMTGRIMASNSCPQCLHLISMSQILTLATLWPQRGHASQVFRLDCPSIIEPLYGLTRGIDFASLGFSLTSGFTPSVNLLIVQISLPGCLQESAQESNGRKTRG